MLVSSVGPSLATVAYTPLCPTVAIDAAGGLALLLWGTLSRSIRAAPSIADVG